MQPSRLWLDCEWNDTGGPLISMALVSESDERFYAVLPCLDPTPWVAANVMPVLGAAPMAPEAFQPALGHFLNRFERIHVVADWPEDIERFCRALITGPGTRLDTPPLTMEVRRDLDHLPSLKPHNALSDAIALRASHLALEAIS